MWLLVRMEKLYTGFILSHIFLSPTTPSVVSVQHYRPLNHLYLFICFSCSPYRMNTDNRIVSQHQTSFRIREHHTCLCVGEPVRFATVWNKNIHPWWFWYNIDLHNTSHVIIMCVHLPPLELYHLSYLDKFPNGTHSQYDRSENWELFDPLIHTPC